MKTVLILLVVAYTGMIVTYVVKVNFGFQPEYLPIPNIKPRIRHGHRISLYGVLVCRYLLCHQHVSPYAGA